MRAWIGLLGLAALLGGCSFAEDKGRGERAVGHFHELYGAARFSDIYVDTTEGFREVANEAEFAEFLGAIRRKLGDVRQSELTGVTVNWSGDGTSIWLSYDTKYELGNATEEFVWMTEGEKTRLESYSIESKELIIR